MGGYLYLLFMILIYIILLFVAHASNHTRVYLWNYVSLMTQLCFDTSTRIVRIVDPSISCRLIAGGRFDHWSTSRRVFTNESISTTFPYTRYKYKYKRSELNRFLYRYRYVISGNFFDRIFFLHECIQVEEFNGSSVYSRIYRCIVDFHSSRSLTPLFANRWSKWKYLWGTW